MSAALQIAMQIAIPAQDAGLRLDRWFKLHHPDVALAHVNKIVRTGAVRLDGARVKISTRLAEGQILRLPPLVRPVDTAVSATDTLRQAGMARPKPQTAEAQYRRALRDMTLFEDRGLLILNKPHGLAVQGGSGTHHHIDALLEVCVNTQGERARLCHRLDRDTSGVLLVALSRKMAADLGALLRGRDVRKLYWALNHGVPKITHGTIALALAKGAAMGTVDERQKARQKAHKDKDDYAAREKMHVVDKDDPLAQAAKTHYALVDSLKPRLSWLALMPVTGRTHQLRAHCEAIGHPIMGDPKYTGTAELKARFGVLPTGMENKLHLHARRIVLPHPKGGTVDVSAPLPAHMQKSFALFGFEETSFDPLEHV